MDDYSSAIFSDWVIASTSAFMLSHASAGPAIVMSIMSFSRIIRISLTHSGFGPGFSLMEMFQIFLFR